MRKKILDIKDLRALNVKTLHGECVQNDEEDGVEDGKIEIYLRLKRGDEDKKNEKTSADKLSTFSIITKKNLNNLKNYHFFFFWLKFVTASATIFHLSPLADVRFHRNVCHQFE